MIYFSHAVFAGWVAFALVLVIFFGSIIALPGVVVWTIVLCRAPLPEFEEKMIGDIALRIYWAAR
jgi:hypothetical protein